MLDGVSKLMPSPSVGGSAATGQLAPSTPVVGPANTFTTEPLPTDFGALLGRMTLEAISTLKASEATSIAGVRGQATTQQVVEAVMSAEQTLQASIAIRDKVVSAYLEVSRMAI